MWSKGNTRTTAVFTIKYLRTLGFAVDNEVFAENSYYFRNALVRANYTNLPKGIEETTEYLESFFRNLLFGEHNNLQCRYLIIGGLNGKDAATPTSKGGTPTSKRAPRLALSEAVRRLLSVLDGTPHICHRQDGRGSHPRTSRLNPQGDIGNLRIRQKQAEIAGKPLYADKEKVQALIDQQRINLADVKYLDLDRENIILNSFVNPQAENES